MNHWMCVCECQEGWNAKHWVVVASKKGAIYGKCSLLITSMSLYCAEQWGLLKGIICNLEKYILKSEFPVWNQSSRKWNSAVGRLGINSWALFNLLWESCKKWFIGMASRFNWFQSRWVLSFHRNVSLCFENLGDGIVYIWLPSGKHLVGQGVLEKCLCMLFHRCMNTLENASGGGDVRDVVSVTIFNLKVYIHTGEENVLFMGKKLILFTCW